MKIKSTFMAPLLVIAVILLMWLSRYTPLDSLAYSENICLAIIVMQLVVLAVPFSFYVKLKGSEFAGRLRIRVFGVEKLLVTLLAVITLILGDILLKLALYNTGIIDSGYSVYRYYLGQTNPGVLYSLITFALIPSVCEELVFRSLLCAEYEESGVITAVVASSLLYAMFGMNFGYFPIYFFTGLMFAHIMYLTRSVFASMLCHLIYSGFDLVAGDTVHTIITKPQSLGFLIFVVAGMFLICLTALFSESERIYYGYALSNTDSRYAAKCPGFRGAPFAKALLAPPFLIAAAVFIAAAVNFR